MRVGHAATSSRALVTCAACLRAEVALPGPDVRTRLPAVEHGFDVISADPPWIYDDQGSRATGAYDGLSCDELEAIPVESLAADRALLFIWCTVAFRRAAEDLAVFWGFRPVSELIWEKVSASGAPRMGIGHYARLGHEIVVVSERGGSSHVLTEEHEIALIATRGGLTSADRAIGSVVREPLPPPLVVGGRAHSRKPARFAELFERMGGPGAKRLELFARETRPGWLCWGNEVPEADAWRAYRTAPRAENGAMK